MVTKEAAAAADGPTEQFTISGVPAPLIVRMNKLQGRLLALHGKRHDASRSAVGRRALELGVAVLEGEVAAAELIAAPSPSSTGARRRRS